MLGFDGFVVLDAVEVDGEVEVVVETTATRVGRPDCGVVAHAHARREVVVRDGSVFERRGRLRWRKRVWRCREAACAKRTWTEIDRQVQADGQLGVDPRPAVDAARLAVDTLDVLEQQLVVLLPSRRRP